MFTLSNTIKTGFLFILMLVFSQVNAQKDSKWKTLNVKVEGVCGMCETRIENALDVKGIKFADWSNETKNCEIVYNSEKMSEEEIGKLLTAIGHDSDIAKATDEQYSTVHKCCKYRTDVTH